MYPSIWMEIDAAGTAAANKGIANGGFVGWSINGVYTSVNNANQNSGFKCAPAPGSVHIDSNKNDIVTGCAVFGYLTPLTKLEASAGAEIVLKTLTQYSVCLACQATRFPLYGYKQAIPAFNAILDTNNVPLYYVTSCTPSPYCDMTVTTNFNGCGRCIADDYSTSPPTFYAFTDWGLGGCAQIKAANCLILSFGATKNCQVCKSGYFLNDDLMCDTSLIPNSPRTAGFYPSPLSRYVAKITVSDFTIGSYVAKLISLVSYNQPTGYGVSSCNRDYIQFPAHPYESVVCGFNPLLYNLTGDYFPGVSTSTTWISKCLQYMNPKAGNGKECGKCANGYLPKDDFTSCVSSVNVANFINCTYVSATTPTKCSICSNGLLNVNGACQLPNINNCLVYSNSNSSISASTQTCTTCMNGFSKFNSGATCTIGQVQWCKKYQDESLTVCLECIPNYSLVIQGTSGYYCYPIPTSLNCAKMSETTTDGISAAKLDCTTCNANSTHSFWRTPYTAGPTVPSTTCLQFNSIPNCNSYSQDNVAISSNSFLCSQCANNFWFSAVNLTCVPRSSQPAQCQTYTFNADTCASCTPGSYLTADAKNCVAFPLGIAFCNQYTGPTTCSKCNSGYYLSNNGCFLSTAILNCLDYSANYTCVNCGPGFFLSSSTVCVAATATNCLTFTSVSACATCSFGWGLLTSNNITSCVNVLALLSNCVNATTVSPFKCITCVIGYFPNVNGTCIQVPLPITNCLIYDTAVTCLLCNQTTILNIDRTACNSTFYANQADPFCGNQTIIPQPACTQCAFGYFFQNGNCVACSSNAYSSGCLSCDPANNSVCLVCAPTYYMNSQGQCVATNFVIPVSSSTTSPLSGSSTVTKALAVSLSLFAVYFDRA